MTAEPERSFDGVKLAILQRRFEGVTRKMANTLLRTARSGVINTARDFSCALVTSDCELLTAADSYPIHVVGGADLMARAMHEMHPVLRPGDAFLHNSPYHGNSHAADHTLLVPVFDDDGAHRFTVLAKAHQADCGNSLPTTYMGRARDVYEEGALIFPAVKVQSDYKDIQDIINICMMRIRAPQQWRGDFLATLGAARIGEQEIRRMGRELGWETLRRHALDWFDLCERQMIETIRGIRAGRARATSVHDPLPRTPEAGIPATADVTVDPERAIITVDMTDNIDCLPVGVNLSHACARTAALVGVFNSLPRPMQPNAGSLRRIVVHLREGCVVGIPRHPTSTSVATTNLGDRVTNAVQSALAAIDPAIGMAEGGAAIPPAAGVVSGLDPRTGHYFVNEVILASAGGGGTPMQDGWLSLFSMGNAGMPFYDSVEVDEMLHPICVDRRHILTDSEGAGRHRGAPGIMTVFRPVDCEMELGFCSDGTVNPAKGVCGGQDAEPARQWLLASDGAVTPLSTSEQVRVRADQAVYSLSCAGGGYGDPAGRDPARVARDVREGWISAARAREVYRTELTADFAVDADGTRRLRSIQPGEAPRADPS